MKKPSADADGFDFFNLKLLSSRCFNSSRINRYSHSINSYRINSYNSSVSSNSFFSSVRFLQDTTVKQQQQLNLKILFHLNLI
jgi:hypothetical protein